MVKWYERSVLHVAKAAGVPRHIAFIMDGNRRWATKHGKAKHEGHSFGLDKLTEVLDWCLILGVSEVTVFALSVENLQRPQEEVEELMRLIRKASERLNRDGNYLNENGVRVRVSGALQLLGSLERSVLEQLMQSTQHNSLLTLNLCIAYGGMEEIAQAVSSVQRRVLRGDIAPE